MSEQDRLGPCCKACPAGRIMLLQEDRTIQQRAFSHQDMSAAPGDSSSDSDAGVLVSQESSHVDDFEVGR